MSHLTISERPDGDAVVLDLSGDIIFGQSNTVLRREVRRLIAEGKTKINLNLTNVFYLDSSGCGELISALIALNRVGGHLKLVNPGERIQELLGISKLTMIFDIEYGENQAAGA